MRIAAMVLAAGLMLVSGCSGGELVQDAGAAVGTFHGRLDAADYEAIWRDTAPEMAQGGGKPQLLGLLAAIHARFGKVRQTKQVGWRTEVDTTGAYTELTMRTTFDRGQAQERLIFRKIDGAQKLAGYNIKEE